MHPIIPFGKRCPSACLLAVQLLSVVFCGFMSDSQLSRLIFFVLAVPVLALLVVYHSPAVT